MNLFFLNSEDFCISDPCQNGGLCDNNIEGTGYECVCDGPYNGKNCENSIYEGEVFILHARTRLGT